jgi:exosortase
MTNFLPWIRQPASRTTLALLGVLTASLLWAYWPTLADMVRRWSHDAQYSHGYLVPAFALYLLWQRRDHLARAPGGFSWWFVPLLLLGGLMRLAGAYFYFAFEWMDSVSLIPTLAAVVLLLAGKGSLRWAGPSVLFLVFMMPLPWRAEVALAHSLQAVATVMSTYLLQAAGFPTFAEGNVIRINDTKVAVEAACSGLSMMMTFFALSAAVALLIDRPLLDRALVLFSAVPIALIANVVRITATGILYATNHNQIAHAVFHDLAGWLMMPLALALLAGELHLLNRLLVEREPRPGPVAFALAGAPAPVGKRKRPWAPTR